MITLEKACEIYMESSGDDFPIDYIRDLGNRWAFFPYAPGVMLGVDVITVNKGTGAVKVEYMFDCEAGPKVEVPEAYRRK